VVKFDGFGDEERRSPLDPLESVLIRGCAICAFFSLDLLHVFRALEEDSHIRGRCLHWRTLELLWSERILSFRFFLEIESGKT
jgi:hypothetical protein